jgi:hypothetical protein
MLPQPQFEVGQTVFSVDVDRQSRRYTCPDCHDTRTWTATSAAGEVFKVNCLRCSQSYSNIDRLPSLEYQVGTIRVKTLTVGSIQMDTNPCEGASIYRYMCSETGVGTGRVYNEGGPYGLFTTEAEALAYGEIARKQEDARIVAQPSHLRAEYYAARTLATAMPHLWRGEIYDAWRQARDYHEAIEAVINDGEDHCGDRIESLEQAQDYLRDAIAERPWRSRRSGIERSGRSEGARSVSRVGL